MLDAQRFLALLYLFDHSACRVCSDLSICCVRVSVKQLLHTLSQPTSCSRINTLLTASHSRFSSPGPFGHHFCEVEVPKMSSKTTIATEFV